MKLTISTNEEEILKEVSGDCIMYGVITSFTENEDDFITTHENDVCWDTRIINDHRVGAHLYFSLTMDHLQEIFKKLNENIPEKQMFAEALELLEKVIQIENMKGTIN